MGDIVDDANDRIEFEISRAISATSRASMKPLGHCHYCTDPVRPSALFCNTDCRDGYDREVRIRKKQGL